MKQIAYARMAVRAVGQVKEKKNDSERRRRWGSCDKQIELYYLMASPVDDRDETGTYGHNRFFCVCRTPICVKCRE